MTFCKVGPFFMFILTGLLVGTKFNITIKALSRKNNQNQSWIRVYEETF
jgi:hypothetical protein